MSIFAKANEIPEPVDVHIGNGTLTVYLADGRTISVPLKWFPRLLHGTPGERARFDLSFDGIHWSDLNEDIPVEGLLRGEKSGESKKSLRRWLRYRARGEKEPILELPLPQKLGQWLAKHIDSKQRKKVRPRRKRAA
jgi:hypothetical protein